MWPIIYWILILAVLICGIIVCVKFYRECDEDLIPIVICLMIFTIIMLGSIGAVGVKWNFGEQKLTGYIYSAEDNLGDSTTGHLRYSLTAGEDEQPSFCVKKADGHIIKELAGSEKKVEVIIPQGFALSNPWDCPIPAEVKVVGSEE